MKSTLAGQNLWKSGNDPSLDLIKSRTWFYEFNLPDGSVTKTDIAADVRRIHTSRREHLQSVIRTRVHNPSEKTALDFASHEGYYSIELAKHFSRVSGLEIRPESIDAARQITTVIGAKNINYIEADLQKMSAEDHLKSDFVLVYGLLYHLENPVHTLRLASELSKKHILIETQVFPYDISGKIEDGHYSSQREVEGVFSLSVDYKDRREGGSTNIALVPSLNALIYLLKIFGFETVEVLKPSLDDYEQFIRGSRVIVYGEKPD